LSKFGVSAFAVALAPATVAVPWLLFAKCRAEGNKTFALSSADSVVLHTLAVVKTMAMMAKGLNETWLWCTLRQVDRPNGIMAMKGE